MVYLFSAAKVRFFFRSAKYFFNAAINAAINDFILRESYDMDTLVSADPQQRA